MDSKETKLYNITLKQPAERADGEIGDIAAALSEAALATSAMREGNNHRGPWVISWITEHEPDLSALVTKFNNLRPELKVAAHDFSLAAVPEVDWLAESYKGFEPFSVERFFIHGSHYEGSVPEGKTGLQIDAATAFGSGEHATTAGCLKLLCSLREQGVVPGKILDLGTGSGILAIAAAKLWSAASVLATDIDEEAVRVTNHHAQINEVALQITTDTGAGFSIPELTKRLPFGLIIANILAGPLKDMAPAFAPSLEEDGYVILSGLLEEQADEISAIYKKLGVAEISREQDRGWTALLLRKVDNPDVPGLSPNYRR